MAKKRARPPSRPATEARHDDELVYEPIVDPIVTEDVDIVGALSPVAPALGEDLSFPIFADELFFIHDQNSDYLLDDGGAEETDSDPRKVMAELAQCDFSAFFGVNGPIAQLLEGYELRPSQVAMADAVKDAILDQQHALIEAPTGTGKSIAYLIPAILSGKTVVVATANKSLQSQLFYKDIPFLRKVLNRRIDAVVVKGRSNYICTHKWQEELVEQQRLLRIDREPEQVTFLRKWLGETDTGDVDDLPFVLESDLRSHVVSFPDDCLHDACEFNDNGCWVNRMRDKAAQAQVLITNHHLLLNALELGFAGERLLPPAPVYVIDEAHGLEQTATSVYETMVTNYLVEQVLARNVVKQYVDADELDELRYQNTLAFQEVAQFSRESAYRVEGELEEMRKLGQRLSRLAHALKQTSPYEDKPGADAKKAEQKKASQKKSANPAATTDARELAAHKRTYDLMLEVMNSAATKLLTVASNKHDAAYVRYAVRTNERRRVALEVHAAPINPSDLLKQYLFDHQEEKRVVICTSATLATDSHFEHFKARCGIEGSCVERVLPPVFDYPRQALLYQPALAAFDYRNADAYYNAASAEIERLLEVSRGRALCLFTSWSGLQQVYTRLRASERTVIWPVRAQGDAPRDALLFWFKMTPNSVLLATRSFWEGVDIPGDDLSLVVLDKMPFPTPSDPLHSARMKVLDDSGRSSFAEYMTPLMTLSLKQGFGRLIRRSTDCGVVAILDERLSSKSYGRKARQDLPPARFSRDFKDVHKFFQSAMSTQVEFALNVWAWPEQAPVDFLAPSEESDEVNEALWRWRWRLLRLQDGKVDTREGVAPAGVALSTAQFYAALDGLQNLRQRIEQARQDPKRYSVEVRHSSDESEWAIHQSADQSANSEYSVLWASEQNRWNHVQILKLDPIE